MTLGVRAVPLLWNRQHRSRQLFAVNPSRPLPLVAALAIALTSALLAPLPAYATSEAFTGGPSVSGRAARVPAVHTATGRIRDDDQTPAPPTISSVAITSRPSFDADGDGRAETYLHRENIDVTVTWSDDVVWDVSAEGAELRLRLDIDGQANTTKVARLVTGGATNGTARSLVFRYAVRPRDRDTDGVYPMPAGNGNLVHLISGATLRDAHGQDASRAHGGLSADPRHQVDGSPDATVPAVVTIADAAAEEGDDITFTVTLDKAVAGGFSVTPSFTDGTATEGTDYTANTAGISFAGTAGETRTFTVATTEDTDDEDDETFTVGLSVSGTSASVTSTSTATGTIRDDDETPATVTIADAAAEEGDDITFTVTLDRAVAGGFTVTPSFTDGTATEGTDYTANTAGISFAGTAGETRTLTVATTEDTDDEDDETFTVGLSVSGTSASVTSTSTATGTIRDDDETPAPPTISSVAITSRPSFDADGDGRAETYLHRENIDVTVTWSADVFWDVSAPGAELRLRLDIDTPSNTTRVARLVTGGATNGTARSLVFRYAVRPRDRDTDGVYPMPAGNGNLVHLISGATLRDAHGQDASRAHGGLSADPRHQVDGSPDATVPAVVTIADAAAEEGDDITFTVTLDKAVAGGFTVTPSFTDGTATEGTDYTANTAGISFAGTAGETRTLTVATTEDTDDEDDETFTVALSVSGTSASVTSTSTATGTIRDDDETPAPPTISSVAITSRPSFDADGDGRAETYLHRENIDVTVTWSADVFWDVSAPGAELRLRLDIDGQANTTKVARLVTGGATSGTARSLVFRYAVRPRDRDTDGVYPMPAGNGNLVHLISGATLRDAHGQDASRAHGGLSADPRHQVDGSPDATVPAVVTIADAAAEEGDDITFTVTLDKAVAGGFTVTPSFTDGTATEGTDYTANTAGISFAGTAGETRTLTVATTEDTDDEDDETFTVALSVSGTSAAVTATSTATGTITDDDETPATVTIADAAAEEGEDITFTMTLDRPVAGGFTVTPSFTDGTATEGTDYTANTAGISFAGTAGETRTFTVATTEDTDDEDDETFTVALSVSGTSASVTSTSTATGTIRDDDEPPATVTIADAAAEEGDDITFTVTLDKAVAGGFSVTPSFTDGTATEGTDYTANTAGISFAGTAGETRTFTVATTEDTDDEDDETFTVGLSVSGTSAAVTATSTATGTITDDDETPATVTIADAAADEGDDITFTVTLDRAVAGGFTVTPSFADGTATQGTDYTANTAGISFAGTAGETRTFTVATTEDTDDEDDETFTVGLSVSGTSASVTSTSTATGTIRDDDEPPAPPTISSVAITSTPSFDADSDGTAETYRRGENIEVTVTWSRNVVWDVSASGAEMRLRLDIDGPSSATRVARLVTGGATNGTARSLVFRYAVRPRDLDTDGVYPTPAGNGNLVHLISGATLKDVHGQDASRAHGGLSADPNHQVDGTPSSVTIADASAEEGDDITFTVTLDKAVAGGFSVTPSFTDGTATEGTDYTANTAGISFAGTAGETRTFTVATTEDTDDEDDETFTVALSVSGTSAAVTATSTATGTITDDDGTPAPPRISSVAITSTPAFDADSDGTAETYRRGENIEVTVTWSRDVVWDVSASGAELRLRLDIEGQSNTTKVAYLVTGGATRGTARSLDFRYAVRARDRDTDGIYPKPAGNGNLVHLISGATLKDVHGQDASRAHGGLSADPNHQVDGTPSSVTIADASAEEGDDVTFAVTLDKPVAGGFTVTPSFTDGTATDGTDYTGNTAAIGFAGTAGETRTFTVATTDDADVEDDETFTVALSVSGTSETVTATSTATGTIRDDDETPAPPTISSVAITSTPSSDANGDGTADTYLRGDNIEVTVTWSADVVWDVSASGAELRLRLDIDGPSSATRVARLVTGGATNGTARSLAFRYAVRPRDLDTDGVYPTPAGNGNLVHLISGATLKDVHGQDASRAHGGLSADPNHQVDGGGANETPAAVTVADAASDEGDDITFTVTLDKAVAGGFSVTPSFTDGTATEGTDYTANTAAISFAGTAGETRSFTVATTDDADVEDDETFTVALSVSGTSETVTATSTATGTIRDDDTASTGLTLSVSPIWVAEDGADTTVTVIAALNADAFEADVVVTVSVGASGDGAIEGTDYQTVNGFVMTIVAGSTADTGSFVLAPTNDDLTEGDETVSVSGSAPGLTVTGAEIMIVDDEGGGVVGAGSAPTFGDATVENQSYALGTAITDLVLPAATGGVGTLAYALSPSPPAGLTFTAGTRTLSGTPTAGQAAAEYTYTATGGDGTADTLTFTIAVTFGCAGSTAVGGSSVTSGRLVQDCETLLASEATLVGAGSALDWDTGTAMRSWSRFNLSQSGVVDAGLHYLGLAGSIAPELGNLSSLEELFLNDNSLTGSIPPELGNLSNLEALHLNDNSLTGSIPPELGDLSSLEELLLTDNSLTGSIPPELGDLSSLALLRLRNNSLTGCIPAALHVLSLNGRRIEINPQKNGVTLPFCPGVPVLTLTPGDGEIAASWMVPAGGAPTGYDLEYKLSSADGWTSAGHTGTGTTATIGSLTNGSQYSARVRANTATDTGDWSGTAMATPAADSTPDFGSAAVANQSYAAGTAITGLVLPAATGGNGTLVYALSPDPPAGLTFTASTRTLSGTPTTGQVATTYTYRVTDGDTNTEASDADSLTFTITVTQGCAGSTAVGGSGVTSGGLVDDCEALLASEATLVGTGTALNWDIGTWMGSWNGVAVASNRVTSVDAERHGLAGSVPRALANLSSLRLLNLAGNSLTGPIPPELGKLAHLRTLQFFNNSLSGSIPAELGNLSSLTHLYLGKNSLTGPIPRALGNLSNLIALAAYQNSLTGSIPTELGNLSNLTDLHLSHNSLTGPIPVELGGLPIINDHFYLNYNHLTGCIPVDLGSFAFGINPQYDSSRENQVNLPACPGTPVLSLTPGDREIAALWNVPAGRAPTGYDLEYKPASDTAWADAQHTGTDTTATLESLTNGTRYEVRVRAKTGTDTGDWSGTAMATPAADSTPDFGSAAIANQSYAAGAAITGLVLPAATGGNGTLVYALSPDPPAGLTFTASTRTLSGTPTTGQVAATYTYRVTDGDTNTEASDADSLTFTITVTQGCAGSTAVGGSGVTSGGLVDDCEALLASEATLVGTGTALNWDIGTWMGRWNGVAVASNRVTSVNLNRHGLAGSVPRALANLSSLRLLNLAGNSLTGPIPPELGKLAHLRTLQFLSNSLSGSIPAELGNLSSLTHLYLGTNSLTGPIPRALGNLSNLIALAAHQNSLTGSIPTELGEPVKPHRTPSRPQLADGLDPGGTGGPAHHLRSFFSQLQPPHGLHSCGPGELRARNQPTIRW